MLSRKTLLLTIAPSLVLVLAVAFSRLVPPDSPWLILALLVAYVLGLPLGIWAARRYGKLVKAYRPLL
jgi:hypothetical protein